MTRKRKHDLDLNIICVEENGEPAIYIEADGKRIAKRGHPDTATSLHLGLARTRLGRARPRLSQRNRGRIPRREFSLGRAAR